MKADLRRACCTDSLAVCWAPDGCVLSAGLHGAVTIWDLASERPHDVVRHSLSVTTTTTASHQGTDNTPRIPSNQKSTSHFSRAPESLKSIVCFLVCLWGYVFLPRLIAQHCLEPPQLLLAAEQRVHAKQRSKRLTRLAERQSVCAVFNIFSRTPRHAAGGLVRRRRLGHGLRDTAVATCDRL